MEKNEFICKLIDIFKMKPKRPIDTRLRGEYEGQYPLLNILLQAKKNKKEITSGDLSDQLCISTARIAKILNILEENGDLTRTKNEEDKRITYVMLTESGERKIVEHNNIIMKKMIDSLDGISNDELDIFYDIIVRIKNNMDRE